jgi:hypothetical protein
MWNMQSGLENKVFSFLSKASHLGGDNTSQNIAISGIVTDALNRILIVAAGGVLNVRVYPNSLPL